MSQFVQQQAAFFAAGMCRQNLATQLADLFEPGAKVLRKLLIDFAAQPLRQRGALTGGGDCDLQWAARDHGPEEEIAVGNIVDAVAEDAVLRGFTIDRRIYVGLIGRRDDELLAIEIGRIEGPLDPLDCAVACQRADFRTCFGRDNAQVRAGLEQAADLVERDCAGPDNQDGTAFEFQKDRQQAHAGFPPIASYSATACGTGPVGKSRSTAVTGSPAR